MIAAGPIAAGAIGGEGMRPARPPTLVVGRDARTAGTAARPRLAVVGRNGRGIDARP